MLETRRSCRHGEGEECSHIRQAAAGPAASRRAALFLATFRAFGMGLALLAVGALLAAACGGGDDGGGDGGPGDSQSELTVDSPADDARRDGVLTLREAMLLATGDLSTSELDAQESDRVQGDPGPGSRDAIVFAAPFQDKQAIVLAEPLPPLSGGNDTIDGSAVDGVTIDGSDRSLICIAITSSDNTLLGLQIVNCRTGILVDRQADENRIGASGDSEGNLISGNVVGIEVRSRGNVIQGNLIGLDATGAEALGNTFEGIWVTPQGRENIIGGSKPGEGNVISGNPLFGISIDGAADNVFQGNLVGLDQSGSQAVTNKYGISVQAGATGNVIGGGASGERNVISGNNTGLLIRDPGTSDNVVRGNYFGKDISGEAEIRNTVDVWEVEDAGENVLEENEMREQP